MIGAVVILLFRIILALTSGRLTKYHAVRMCIYSILFLAYYR